MPHKLQCLGTPMKMLSFLFTHGKAQLHWAITKNIRKNWFCIQCASSREDTWGEQLQQNIIWGCKRRHSHLVAKVEIKGHLDKPTLYDIYLCSSYSKKPYWFTFCGLSISPAHTGFSIWPFSTDAFCAFEVACQKLNSSCDNKPRGMARPSLCVQHTYRLLTLFSLPFPQAQRFCN